MHALLADWVSTNVAWWFILSLAPMVAVIGIVIVIYDKYHRDPKQ
jgi:hypothetical protein